MVPGILPIENTRSHMGANIQDWFIFIEICFITFYEVLCEYWREVMNVIKVLYYNKKKPNYLSTYGIKIKFIKKLSLKKI